MTKPLPPRTPHGRVMLRAADLLSEQAEGIRESCRGNGYDWACGSCPERPCPAKREYRQLKRACSELRKAAK